MSDLINMTPPAARRIAAQGRPGSVSWYSADIWIRSVALLVTAVLIGRTSRKLPVEPLTTGDSYAYQYLFDYRPPFYGWFLNAWQAVTGSLDYLSLLHRHARHRRLCLLG